jgi:glycerol kinase
MTGKELEEYMEKKQIINQYDILPQIAYWMEITPPEAWALEGKVFLDRYEAEFLK